MGGRGEPELTGFVQNVVLIKKVQTQAATVAWKQVKDDDAFEQKWKNNGINHVCASLIDPKVPIIALWIKLSDNSSL